MTTNMKIPEPRYRRLDFAQLPPYRLEKMSQSELKAAIPFYHIFCAIRFKNVWDHEKEAKRAEDEQKADLARTVTRRTQTKTRKCDALSVSFVSIAVSLSKTVRRIIRKAGRNLARPSPAPCCFNNSVRVVVKLDTRQSTAKASTG